MISTSASQKLGIAWPSSASRPIALSIAEPSRMAAMMPSGNGDGSAMTRPVMPRVSVIGSRSRSGRRPARGRDTSGRGRPARRAPPSRGTAPAAGGRGRSSCGCVSMSCAVALGPAMEMARSPDSRVSAKLMTSTVRQTSRASTARRSRKRSMAQPIVPTRSAASAAVRCRHDGFRSAQPILQAPS